MESQILSSKGWGVPLRLMTFYIGDVFLLVRTVLLSLLLVIADLLQLYSLSDNEFFLSLGFAFLEKEE